MFNSQAFQFEGVGVLGGHTAVGFFFFFFLPDAGMSAVSCLTACV